MTNERQMPGEKQRALDAIKLEYPISYAGSDEKSVFIRVENPKYQPDSGENPYLVIDLVTPQPQIDVEGLKASSFDDEWAYDPYDCIDSAKQGWNDCIDYLNKNGLLRTTPENTRSDLSEWQPIETAPKDGTRILGYLPPTERLQSLCLEICSLDLKWFSVDSDEELFRRKPTHWMLLPPHPKDDE